MMSVTVQSDRQALPWFYCWKTISSFLLLLCEL